MKLYFFTSSFPYGIGETWKLNELKYLAKHFNEIIIIPYSFGGNESNPKVLPAKVISEKPIFANTPFVNYKSFFTLFDKNFLYYFTEFFKKKVYLNKRNFLDWLLASVETKLLLKNELIKSLINKPDKEAVVYFFWGKGSASIAPFLDKQKFAKIVVRFHRYDLFEDENYGYIPYRERLLKNISLAAPCSNYGTEYLQKLYPSYRQNITTIRLGTISGGTASQSIDGKLRIVSCSFLTPVKRVHIIAEALALLSFPVIWFHIGEGPQKELIEKKIKDLPNNIEVNLLGKVESTEVINFYISTPLDLFINTSISEGVPVSIMEAFSAAIPVFATNAGGTREIVDNSVGRLLPKDLTPELLAFEIIQFNNLSFIERSILKSNAFGRYESECNSEILSNQFAMQLIN